MSDGNEKLYDFKARSDESGLLCEDPSLTVQADKDDADINVIVHRFGITGTMPQSVRIPEYSDYEEVFDYHSAQMAILDADRQFMSIPAQVRAKFDNDPGKFLVFASDPGNLDAMIELGLAPARVPVDNPPADVPPEG